MWGEDNIHNWESVAGDGGNQETFEPCFVRVRISPSKD